MIKFTTDYTEDKVRKFLINEQLRNTPNLRLFPKLIIGVLAVFLIAGYPHTWKADFLLPLSLVGVIMVLIQRPVYQKIYNIQYQDTYGAESVREHTVDEEGIHCLNATQEAHYRWAFFQKSEIKGDFYCLRGRDQQTILCRISQLSAEDFEALQAMAAACIKTR